MGTLLGMVFFCLSAFSEDFVDKLPNGHFAGVGVWTDNLNASGRYQTYVEIYENSMRIDYSWGENQITESLSFWFNEPSSFDVFLKGEAVGYGTCKINECHLIIDKNGAHYVESFYFKPAGSADASLVKAGHYQVGSRVVQWQDKLQWLDLGEPLTGDPLP